MGIYIKGMEMPRFGECIVITSDGVASKYLGGDVAIYYDAHPEKASAVELPPHGRLIDADALMQRIEHDTPLSDVFEKTMRRYLHNAPTIIPADPEKEENQE